MSTADELLAWGRRLRLRAEQRAALPPEQPTEPAPRPLWRARATYSRRGQTWAEAGVHRAVATEVEDDGGDGAPGSCAALPGVGAGVDLQLLVHPFAGGILATVVEVSGLPAGPPAPGGADEAVPDAIQLELLSEQRLFAHQLYPAAVVLARMLDSGLLVADGRTVLELGAGAALPCILAALHNAAAVVASDFPQPEMLRNTRANLEGSLPEAALRRTRVVGHAWGADASPLLGALADLLEPSPHAGSSGAASGFELILLSDLLYELEHEALLRSCVACLASRPHARVVAAFQPHDPIQLQRQLGFFTAAAELGLESRRLLCVRAPPMFRAGVPAGSPARLVHVFELRRRASPG